jgi:hypothetical protein
MKQLGLGIIVAIGLTLPAQAQSLRDQLVGAWSLVSCNPNIQEIASACGTNPNGILIYDASGSICMDNRRTRASQSQRRP